MTISLAKVAPQRPIPWSIVLPRASLRLVAALGQIRKAAEERRQLLALDERELRDIGINRLEALREADRPLWRWPA